MADDVKFLYCWFIACRRKKEILNSSEIFVIMNQTVTKQYTFIGNLAQNRKK